MSNRSLFILYVVLILITISTVIGNVINEYVFKENIYKNKKPINHSNCYIEYQDSPGIRINAKKGIQYEPAPILQNP